MKRRRGLVDEVFLYGTSGVDVGLDRLVLFYRKGDSPNGKQSPATTYRRGRLVDDFDSSNTG